MLLATLNSAHRHVALVESEWTAWTRLHSIMSASTTTCPDSFNPGALPSYQPSLSSWSQGPCWFDSSPGHHSILPFPKCIQRVARFAENGSDLSLLGRAAGGPGRSAIAARAVGQSTGLFCAEPVQTTASGRWALAHRGVQPGAHGSELERVYARAPSAAPSAAARLARVPKTLPSGELPASRYPAIGVTRV
jgi:hypothetical protein